MWQKLGKNFPIVHLLVMPSFNTFYTEHHRQVLRVKSVKILTFLHTSLYKFTPKNVLDCEHLTLFNKKPIGPLKICA